MRGPAPPEVRSLPLPLTFSLSNYKLKLSCIRMHVAKLAVVAAELLLLALWDVAMMTCCLRSLSA